MDTAGCEAHFVSDGMLAGSRSLASSSLSRAWVEKNPLAVGAGLLVLVIWHPKGALGLAKKGLLSWRAWRLVRGLTRNLLA